RNKGRRRLVSVGSPGPAAAPRRALLQSLSAPREPVRAPRPAAIPTKPSARHQHREVSGGGLPPAFSGAIDGLHDNVSLHTGGGGVGASAHALVLTGLAVL